MKSIYQNLVWFVWLFLLCFPVFWECTREDDYCVEGLECKDASNNYTVPYCVSSEVDYAASCNFTSIANSLSSHFDEKDFTTKDMISDYCAALLWNQDCTATLWNGGTCQNCWRIYFSKPNAEGNRDWSQTFDSHQSLFVYLLCSSAVDRKGSIDFSEAFKWDATKLLKLQQMVKWKDQCSLKKSPTLDDCDMSMYATEIFSAIMSDIFKIKYAQIFHVDSVNGFENKKKRVAAFLSWYFDEDDEKTMKDFPDTVDVIDSNQQYYKSVLKTLRLLDNSKLAKIAEESGCPSTWNVVWVNYLACALHSSQWNWSSLSPEFPTLFYNEVLAYRMFVAYYSNWVQSKIKILDDSNDKDKNEKKEEWNQKDEDLQYYAGLQIEAATQTLRNFVEMNMTYPLHIWLLLYQEKIREYRNKFLPPVVKQFYSLSEKLQNVQLPD